ncbi:MAG TPA: cupredoxin domain-containing protein [Gemmatimonadales bacterium]|nr:cupredoxin domain-containing protein [Gemmatimonadales bacterium]
MRSLIAIAALAALTTALGAAGAPPAAAQATDAVRLTEWKVELASRAVPAGDVTFTVTNAGTIPHGFEVEGRGIEREIELIQPGQSASLTVTLRPGRYEVYCPVGGDSHKNLGMVARLQVTGAAGAPASGSSSGQYGMSGGEGSASDASGADAHDPAPRVTSIAVAGGAPVVQILPGPFPFADSAAAVIASRPDDQRMDLTHKAQLGPYSDSVARIAGTIAIRAWDFGPTRDSVEGRAELTTADGARWRLVLDSVQTRDIPDNPRFGGVIMGLYYHGATGVHTPLVPTIRSAVALWAWAHLWRNDSLATDRAMVHVMLLSQTRRDGTFALECWDCSKNPIRELQLQVTPAPGQPKLDAPGGVLFVNWERATRRGA